MNIVITGASSGIGRATVQAIASLGNHTFFVIGRNKKELDQLKKEVHEINELASITTFAFDLNSEETQFTKLASTVQQVCPHLDVLINNAGIFIKKPFSSLRESDWQVLFETNIFAAAKMTKAFLPLLNRSQQAHIVNIGSMGGLQGSPKFAGLSAYSASKAALASFTECLAAELPSHIHSNCLCFGSVATAMFDQAFPNSAASMTKQAAGVFIADFALRNWHLFNGKVIPIATGTP